MDVSVYRLTGGEVSIVASSRIAGEVLVVWVCGGSGGRSRGQEVPCPGRGRSCLLPPLMLHLLSL